MPGRHKSKILARPNLRVERLAQGWIARDFAHRIGISRSHLSLIETRQSGVSEGKAVAIAQLLHKDFDELFEIISIEDQEENALHAVAG